MLWTVFRVREEGRAGSRPGGVRKDLFASLLSSKFFSDPWNDREPATGEISGSIGCVSTALAARRLDGKRIRWNGQIGNGS